MTFAFQPFNPAAAQVGSGAFNRADLWDSGDSGGPSISTENGMFSCYKDGQKVGNSVPAINVVVVGQFPEGRRTYRTFWAARYNPKATPTPPDCWSPDGKHPSPSAKAPQAQACEGCPKNVKGSGDLGGDSRACAFRKNLSVVVPEMGDTVFTLRASAKAIFSEFNNSRNCGGLFAYDAQLGKLVPQEVVATLSFPFGSTEGFRFSPVGTLNPAQAKWMIEAGRRPEVVAAVQRIASADLPSNAALPAPNAAPALPAYTAPIAGVEAPVAPVYQAPVQQAPVYQAPVQQAPVYQAPVQQAPVYQAPVQQPPVYQAPVAPMQPLPWEAPQAPVQQQVAPQPVAAEQAAPELPPVPRQAAVPVDSVPVPAPQVAPPAPAGASHNSRLMAAFNTGPGAIDGSF